jgi:hypothetical protein
MFGKKNKKDEEKEEKKFARLISQECKYAKYSETEILEVARDKAKKYNDAVLYYLRIWESQAACGGFSLELERKRL